MKIERIVTQHLRYEVPADRTIVSSQKRFDTREITLVKVYSDDGVWGVGESLGRPDLVIPIIERSLKPLLIGENPLDISRLWAMMLAGSWFRAQTGLIVEALSAIDIALWDLKGKLLNTPVYNLLGGAFRLDIPIYVTGLYLSSPEILEEQALRFIGHGHRALKLKIGYPEGIQKDIESIRHVQSVVGKEISLMVDANGKYSLVEATRLLHEIADFNLLWIEEPLKPFGPEHDLEGYRYLSSIGTTPIAWGEGEYLLSDCRDFLAHRCIHIFQPDVCRFGGITETFRATQFAEQYRILYAPHFWTSGIGLAATLHLAASAGEHFHLCEFDQSPNELREHIVSTQFPVREGRVQVPEGPGLGIDLNDELIEEYIVMEG